MRLGAVRDYAGRDAEEGRVEGQHALDVGEHEGVGRGGHGGRGFVGAVLVDRVVDRVLGRDGDGGLGGDDAAHGVADEDHAHGGVDGGRGGAGCDFEVDDFVEEPGNLVEWLGREDGAGERLGGRVPYQSLKRETHSPRSPRVSYLG